MRGDPGQTYPAFRHDASTPSGITPHGAEPAEWTDYDIRMLESGTSASHRGAASRHGPAGSSSAAPAPVRFLLDNAVVTAGRGPDSDIFLDDVTVSAQARAVLLP